MPKYEYRGILARPGAYMYKWGTEIKTYEELKRAFERTPSLMLTLGHPLTPNGKPRIPEERDFIGRVDAVFNDERQVIEGVFKPYDGKYWERIPEHIRQKIVNDEPYGISLGYPQPLIVNGEQTDMLFNHCAVLRDGEDPTCPLGECGINVRLESSTGEIITMRYEQATSTRDEPEPEGKEETAEPPRAVTVADLDRFKADILGAVKALVQPTEEAGAQPAEEELPSVVEEPSPAEAPRPEPTLEPKRAFPAGSATEKNRFPYMKADGSVEVPVDIYMGKTKNKQTKQQ